MDVAQMDGIGPDPSLGEQDEQNPHENHKEGLPHYLGKLEEQGSLACPESIEEPGEEVDGFILYQAVEEETMENSLDTDTLMGSATGQEEGPVECTNLADQVDEISEGHHVSLMDETPMKDVKPNKMVLQSIYSEYAPPSCPDASVSTPNGTLTPNDTSTKSSGVKTDQEDYRVEHLNLPDGGRNQDSKVNLLEQNEMALPSNSIETKPSDLKFYRGAEKKPQPQELPVKLEETKTEALDVYPDSSELKHGRFLPYRVKSENSVTKAEQLDYPVKPETPETKPEDLSLSMKTVDRKPEVLQFAAYSEIKPEAKPMAYCFATYPDGVKTETEPEDLSTTAFVDRSAIKPEAKSEGLEFTNYPDSSEMKPEAKPEDLAFSSLPEIKAETKQELLEADSTVLTPKLEQGDGLGDAPESLGGRGPVKEERPSTPGEESEF